MNWDLFLNSEMDKPYFKELMKFVDEQYNSSICYPSKENIFNAFKYTKLDNLKAVILGQDPYHEPNQAHGLSFSVLPSQPKLPPSLRNIYKEIADEYGCINRQNGCLTDWAEQGVLLLNTVMTVQEHKANSHKQKGWEIFTDSVISYINELDKPVVFLLWGNPAQAKKKLLTNPNHLVLCAAHPSPLSAYRGFFGCGHFKACNEYLIQKSIEPINWTGSAN